METDPILDALGKYVPVVLLVILGLFCIYSVVGVPLGILFLGLAAALGYFRVRPAH